jgi:30S ribosomal protein S31
MGKGDIKSGKGKRTNGSYGNTRKRKKAKTNAPAAAEKTAKPAAEKKAPAVKKTAAAKPAAEKKPAVKKTVKKEADTEE